jgi:YrbI family 3-deoxy-D-manno-octulosonate 8-phosphate phosphatase
LLVLDVDGVLTDGSIHLDDNGVETKCFHVRDGQGIKMWMHAGHHLAIITGRSGSAVQHRARELNIKNLMQGAGNKRASLQELMNQLNVTAEQTAIVGDDLPDLPMLEMSGYPIAVADAVPEVRRVARFITTKSGGHGAVREAIEHLLKRQSRWQKIVNEMMPPEND